MRVFLFIDLIYTCNTRSTTETHTEFSWLFRVCTLLFKVSSSNCFEASSCLTRKDKVDRAPEVDFDIAHGRQPDVGLSLLITYLCMHINNIIICGLT